MSSANFYRVLGVQRSAGSAEIRAAFRELVKKHHPDLFSTRSEKEKATERLRQINEAYAVLGNSERRRDYDRSLVREPRPRQPPRARRRRESVRVKPKVPRGKRFRFRFPWTVPSRKKLVYSLGAAAGALLLFYASRTEPHWIMAWVLVEKLEISAEGGGTPQQQSEDWSAVAQFASASDCAVSLKAKVQEDERQGAKAVFDERSGLMGITVQAGTAADDAPTTDSGAAAQPEAEAQSGWRPAAPVLKRVRNLECRVIRKMEMSSWIERMLRRAGLLS